ncbi:MAG TPA: alpha/beta fold hydrolase [Chloroflexia bacterium]
MQAGTNGYIELPDGRIYYETAGEGETLVLVHAGFVDSRMWDDQWDEFTRAYRVIRFDMRGYGRSSPPDEPVSNRRDLLSVLEHLGVERAHFLGCSLGGGTVLDFALERPEMVLSLTLVCATPGGFELQGEPPPHLFEMIAALQEGDLERGSELQIRIWVDGMFRQPEQVDQAVRQRAAEMNRISIENGMWAKAGPPPDARLEPPAVERLDEIRVPTLLIVGALDHPEILRGVDLLATEIEGARKVVLPDSAHLPNMERPEEFNRAVLGFLGEVQST